MGRKNARDPAFWNATKWPDGKWCFEINSNNNNCDEWYARTKSDGKISLCVNDGGDRCAKGEPFYCNNTTATALDQAWRNVGTSGGNENDCTTNDAVNHPMGNHPKLADASWYHFVGDAGTRMPTSPFGGSQCGTYTPG